MKALNSASVQVPPSRPNASEYEKSSTPAFLRPSTPELDDMSVALDLGDVSVDPSLEDASVDLYLEDISDFEE